VGPSSLRRPSDDFGLRRGRGRTCSRG
jgi:hypothetical protein